MADYTPVADPADIAAVEDVLKEVWPSDNVEDQLYNEMRLLDLIEADVTEFTDSNGLRAAVPIRTGRTAGISARGLNQPLGVPGHQGTRKAHYEYKNLYLQVQVLGPVIARMRTNRQSAVREINFEVENGITDFKMDYIRQLLGDGSAQITLAGLPGGGSSRTVALGAENFAAIERGWLYEDMPIDIGTAVDPRLDTSGNKIVSIDDTPSAPRIVLENATATTAGSHISRHGNRDATDGSYEVNGLESVVSATSRLGGVDPATVRHWKATVLDNGGTARALSLDLLMELRRRIRIAGGGVPDLIYMDLVQEQAYYNLLQPQVRFAGDRGMGGGKTDDLDFNGLSITADPHALPGQVVMGRKKALKMYSAGKFAWQNQTVGGNLLAWVQGYDAFMARAAKYCQLGSDHRNAFGKVDDLAT